MPTETWRCKPCNLLFGSWEAIMKHKATMRGDNKKPHFHCRVCGEDFKTEMAEIRHIQLLHAQQQELICPGCGKGPFVRVGGLMMHIETDCIRIDISTIEEMREKKMEFSQKLTTLTKATVKSDYRQYMPSAHDFKPSFDTTSEKPDPFECKQNDFPKLPNEVDSSFFVGRALPGGGVSLRDYPDQSENERPNAWDKKKNLFPNAPPAQRPSQEQLEAVKTPSARVIFENLDPHDPDHPGFNAGRYYCKYSEKYDCPRVGCGKTFKKARGLIGHLKSPAHADKNYHCPYCHKIFTSLSAITQHAESQGSFCRIRDTETFDAYMDQLTAGIIDIERERNEDGTLKYNTTEAAMEAFGRSKGKGKEKVVDEPVADEGWKAAWDNAGKEPVENVW